MLKKYHPDVCLQGKEYAQQKTLEINEAYEKIKEYLEEQEDIKNINNFFKEEKTKTESVRTEEKKPFSPALFLKELFKKIKVKFKKNSTKPKSKVAKEKKVKFVKNTLIKDERKQERNWSKIFLDIVICGLSVVAIILIVLFAVGVIKWTN